ncbi:retrovirus-related pol polyprotein from transposon TNT 1-94 [Tanacetum coccineum]
MLDLIINQHKCINYDKSYALVARLEAIRIFLAISTYMNFIVYQMDVKSAFLNGKLKEEVYVKQPLSFESSEFPNHVCKSDKALMDLNKLQEHGMKLSQPFSLNISLLNNLKDAFQSTKQKYVKDLLKKYDINGSSVKTLMVPPNKLGPDLIGKAVNETQYKGMIGSLMYLIARRPDIQFSSCLCARYQANSKESYLIIVKRIFRHLKGTPSHGL